MSQGQSSNSGDAICLGKEKLAYLEIEKAKTASASQKFELEKQLEESKREIHRLESAGFVRHKETSALMAQAFTSSNKRQGWENASDAFRSSLSQTTKTIDVFISQEDLKFTPQKYHKFPVECLQVL